MSDRAYVQAALRGESMISDPVVSRVTGEISIIIAAPLWENGAADTKVAGCVYVVPDTEFLNNIMNSIKISETSVAYMINAQGDTIADQTNETVAEGENIENLAKTDSGYADLAALHAKVRSGETGIASVVEQGITEFVCYAPVAETNGWSVLITADHDDFMESTRTMMITTIIMVLAGQVIVSVIAIRLGRGIAMTGQRKCEAAYGAGSGRSEERGCDCKCKGRNSAACRFDQAAGGRDQCYYP